MYLARKHINGKIYYSLRESYKDNAYYKSRDLIDLGVDPTRFIVYPGGTSFYIHEDIITSCSALAYKQIMKPLNGSFSLF